MKILTQKFYTQILSRQISQITVCVCMCVYVYVFVSVFVWLPQQTSEMNSMKRNDISPNTMTSFLNMTTASAPIHIQATRVQ